MSDDKKLTTTVWLLFSIVKSGSSISAPEKLKCVGMRTTEPDEPTAHLTVKINVELPRQAIIPEIELSLDRVDLMGAVQRTRDMLKDLQT